METYKISSFDHTPDWEQISPLTIDNYPWYEKGMKQDTSVKLALVKDRLHLKVSASDLHSSAHVVENNGSVYLDSCFEFFFRPEAIENDHYINLEINAIGTIYLAVRNEEGKRRASHEEINQVEVITSLVKGVVKEVSPDDRGWDMDIIIPLSFIEGFYGKVDNNQWWANFYRCGGDLDDQYATWNPVETPAPDFHQPRQFGQLIFD